MELNERVLRYLSACPPAISGQEGHNTTFALTCSLMNGFALTETETLEYLQMWNVRCQPPWSERELIHKVQQAAQASHSKPRGHLIGENGFTKEDFRNTSFQKVEKIQKPQPANIDPVTAIENFLKGRRFSEAELYDASPIKPSEDYSQDGVLLITHLFKPGEGVNFVTRFEMSACKDGSEKPTPDGWGFTIERDELIGGWELVGMPKSKVGGWMRMNPMDGKGIRDTNVTVYRHILLEFDSVPLELQISLFACLPLPISAILTSGGKSVHAWVRVDAIDATCFKDQVETLFKRIGHLGIDKKNKNPSRLSRLPGVTREIGASGDGRQRLIYLAPNPTQRSII